MLMSKSRLEKFLYALYSLDSSDLPNPLSRIEELYKCLVTGADIPTFEPLSRVEKYLMAILGVYDTDSLPNPLSRVEVLLYKLATGDDNLDDVKSFLSEHEELLAEIIRNGGVGGNIDIEYVLYTLSTEFNTLYNTAEKPVKSAILKGQTLVNLASCCEVNLSSVSKIETGFKFKAMAEDYDHKIDFLSIAKPDTYYTYIFTSDTAFEYYTGWDATNSGSWNQPTHQAVVGLNVLRVKTEVSTTKTSLLFRTTGNRVGNKDVYLTNFMILEGDYTNLDIPYFEGMQSVKMPVLKTTGKNLFPTNNFIEYGTDNQMVGQSTFEVYLKSGDYCSSYSHADDSDKDTMLRYKLLDEQGNQVLGNGAVNRTFTIENNGLYKLQFGRGSTYNGLYTKIQVQLEEGSVATEYEPYKSNILTVNEEVELGSVGNVYDTLDLLTGDVISRTGLYTYKGEIEPYFNQSIGGYVVNVIANANVTLERGIISDKFINRTFTNYDAGVYGNNNGAFYFFDKLTSSAQEFKEKYIGTNFRFELKENSIKTVDLSVVDQDGNNTELSTFNDITHVELSSEGLIPEAELEVATKNEEVLNTTSLEMEDISATQTTLEETTSKQSENVDATMIAMTEIYEGLL